MEKVFLEISGEKLNNKIGRIEFIDIAKGLLMILVIFNHLYGDCYLHRFISTFHMPAFFILSGMVFHSNRPWKSFLFRKVYTIMIPYIFFEGIGTIINNVIFDYGTNFNGFIYNTVTQNCMVGADWFLPALFIGNLLLYCVHKITDNKISKLLLLTVFLIVPCFFPSEHFFHIIGRSMLAFSFMEIGFLTKKWILEDHFLVSITAALITVIMPYLNELVGMIVLQMNNPVLFFIGSLTGSYAIISISKRIHNRYIEYLGVNSLVIMGTHQLIIKVLFHYIPGEFLTWEVKLILLFVIIFMEIPIIWILNHIFPFFIGRSFRLNSQSKG